MKEKLVFIIIMEWIEEEQTLTNIPINYAASTIAKMKTVIYRIIRSNKSITQPDIRLNSVNLILINHLNVIINSFVGLHILKPK